MKLTDTDRLTRKNIAPFLFYFEFKLETTSVYVINELMMAIIKETYRKY